VRDLPCHMPISHGAASGKSMEGFHSCCREEKVSSDLRGPIREQVLEGTFAGRLNSGTPGGGAGKERSQGKT